jgi:hypothetical protein
MFVTPCNYKNENVHYFYFFNSWLISIEHVLTKFLAETPPPLPWTLVESLVRVTVVAYILWFNRSVKVELLYLKFSVPIRFIYL